MRNLNKVLLGLFMCINIFATGAVASDGEHKMQMTKEASGIIANPKGTKESRGVTSLQDYIVEEQAMYDWLFKNHPIFTKYGGKTVGELHVAIVVKNGLQKVMVKTFLKRVNAVEVKV